MAESTPARTYQRRPKWALVTSAIVAWDEPPQALLEPATKLVAQRA
jgi:hypothetical protein